MQNKNQISVKTMYYTAAIALILLTFLSFFMSETNAWKDLSQHSSDEFYGASKQPGRQVVLNKLEKDGAGNVLQTPVPDAEFYLYQKGDPDRQIGVSYRTDKYGQIFVAESLPPGSYYFEEVRLPFGYDYDLIDGEAIKRYDFEVTEGENEKAVIVYAYNRRKTGDLSVTKMIRPIDDSDLNEEQKEEQFAFIITFSDKGTYLCRIDGGAGQWIASGDTIVLMHGQTALIEGFPYGLQYHITEVHNSEYYVHSTNDQGTIMETLTEAVFVNTPVIKETYSLEISKEVSGADANEEKEFSFTVFFSEEGSYFYQKDGGEFVAIKSGDKIQLSHGQLIRIMGLPAGTTYRVVEDDYSGEGYISNYTEYEGIIALDGTRLQFKNIKEDTPEETGGLTFTKKVIGESEKDQQFKFTVQFSDKEEYDYEIDGKYQGTIADGGSIHIEAGQRVFFPNLPHGIIWHITETDLPEECDPVIAEAGGMIIGGRTAEVPFTNVFRDVKQGRLRIHKLVEGEIPETDKGKQFAFSIYIDGVETTFMLGHDEYREFVLNYGSEYQIYEQDYSSEGYMQQPFGNSHGVINADHLDIEVINRYTRTVMTEIQGEKSWDLSANPEIHVPDSILVYLKKGDQTIAKRRVIADKDGRWRYSFTVPKYEADGKTKIRYTLEEEPVAGFTAKVTGYNIRNTAEPPEQPVPPDPPESPDPPGPTHPPGPSGGSDEIVTVKGSKIWDHGDNAPENWPESVTILIKNGEQIVVRKEITQEEHWRWHFELDRYDSKGRQIKYTIDEEKVEGYGKYIEGYDIYNSYGLPDGERANPKTGDSSEFMGWVIVLIISQAVFWFIRWRCEAASKRGL